MFKFINRSPSNLQKRKQTNRACERCRQRKKRCIHVGVHGDVTDRILCGSHGPLTETQPNLSTTPSVQSQNSLINIGDASASGHSAQSLAHQSNSAQRTDHPRDCEDENARFVGDLNPEATFLAATNPETVYDTRRTGVGVWLSRRTAGQGQGDTLQLVSQSSLNTSIHPSQSPLSKALLPLLEAQGHRLLPQPSDVAALVSIYLDDIHPIFPVVHLDAYDDMPPESPTKMIITQAICLAASSNPRAKRFLTLATDTPLSSDVFAARISSAITVSLDFRVLTNKIVLIQILALLSLFTQLSKDNYSSADHLSQAVSYTHTLGLHHKARRMQPDDAQKTTLFCCVWALDRLNAAFHGRPVLIHERDITRDLETCFKEQKDYFKLFLRVILLLDKVIGFYRPSYDGSTVSWESDFPAFEDLVYNSCSSHLSSNLIASIETLYHAVVILTCRSQSPKEPVRSSASYVRQCLSAARVTSIVTQEYREQLSQFPTVPYAVSLALRFYYREVRLSRAPIFRNRARSQLLLTCKALRELGNFFSCTMSMVEMVEQILREMDKVCSNMANVDGNGIVTSQRDNSRNSDLVIPVVDRNTSNVGANPAQTLVNNTSSVFDPSVLDSIPVDFDIFEYFDPDIDLDAIDAIIDDSDIAGFPIFPGEPV